MKIVDASIVHQAHGVDIVFLRTTLPDATYPFRDTLFLEFRTAKDGAEAYLAAHFPGVPIVQTVSKS